MNVAVLFVVLATASTSLAQEGEWISKAEYDDQVVKQTLELDDKRVPTITTKDGNVEYRVKRDNDVTFNRIRLQEASVFENAERLAKLEQVVSPDKLVETITAAINNAMAANQQVVDMVKEIQELNSTMATQYVSKKDFDDLKQQLLTANQQLKSQTEAAIQQQADDGAALQKNVTETLNSKVTALTTEVNKAVDDKLKPIATSSTILDRLKLTYLSNPNIPVYRWTSFHTHHHGISWIDENQNQGFGGIHPSQWTDGNYRANQMADDFRYLSRLFTRKQTANRYGATICSEVENMYSSTTGRVCGALFRIRNTGTSTVRWSPDMTMTSFTGWSEMASISLNGANTWNSNCQYECRFRVNINIPANSQKNRVSTVIFISTSSHPRGHYSSQERGTILMFRDNALALPNGLEYVDDLDTASGRWKI